MPNLFSIRRPHGPAFSGWFSALALGALFAAPVLGDPSASEPVSGGAGGALFASQCAECHSLQAPPRDPLAAARSRGPSLHDAGWRLRPDWVESWLVRPEPVRPAGYLPFRHTVATAEGDRIDASKISPHPRSTPEEAAAIAEFLQQRDEPMKCYPPADPNPAIRAAVHFSKILPCGGCHRVGDAGGISGPDLTHAGDRLQAEWVRSFVWDPAAWGNALMPKVRLRADQLLSLAEFVVADPEAEGDAERFAAAPAMATAQMLGSEEALALEPVAAEHERAGEIYQVLCSQCHGVQGNGKGLNAAHLFLSPRDHTSYDEMARLTDQRIYDAISLGGAAVGKSSLMPSWGAVLAEDDIWLLVAYLRELSGTS